MNMRLLAQGRVCRVVCVVLSVVMATEPTADVVAQAPVKESKSGGQSLDQGAGPVVEQPRRERMLNDTTLLAAPTAGKIDLTYVSPQAVALLAGRPRQLLTSPTTAMMPVEVASAAGLQQLGVDPADVEEIIAFSELPLGVSLPYGVIIKFWKPFELGRIPEKLRAHARPAELAGKSYLASGHPRLPSFYMPNERTLLVMPEATLQKVLAPDAGGLAGALLERVRALPADNDVYAVVDVAALRPLIVPLLNVAAMQQREKFPQEAKPFLEVPNLISAVDLTLNVTTSAPTTLVVHANDAASADRLEELHALLKSMQRKEIARDAAKLQASEDPVERSFGHYLERISNISIDAYKLERQGDSLVLFQGFKMDSPEQRQLMTIAVTGFLVALILPAIQAAREAARRNQSMSKLKQLILAMHMYADTKKVLPPNASYSPDGKPLLSWRVLLLPHLGYEQLYSQFKLDEPWDSEHNRKLIPLMPPEFDNPNIDEPGKTDYLALVGKECVMDGSPNGIGFARISDGMSKTIVLVEADADQAVEWTKPDDIEFDANNPKSGFGKLRPGGCSAAFADGHVQFISNDIDPQLLKALVTRNGREAITVP